MKNTPRNSAVTLAEVMFAITVLVVVALCLFPRIYTGVRVGLVHDNIAQMLNNARQLQIATQMMAMDMAQSGTGLAWTTIGKSEKTARPATLEEYYGALTSNNYVSQKELIHLLTAPGIGPGPDAPSVANSAFTFFWVKESSPKDQVLLMTAKWTPRGLDDSKVPYGAKGFVVMTKDGHGTMSRRASDADPSKTNLFPTDSAKGYSTVTLK